MTIDGKLGTYSRDDQRASDPGHGPVLLAGKIKTDDGDYPVGLLLTRKSDGNLEPLQVITAEVLATGDGATKAYAGALAAALPIIPGTLTITDGVEIFSDDGLGNLTGDATGTGTIVYETGAYSITFNANVVNEVDVVAGYTTRVDGVLDDAVDTTATGSALYIKHGTCRQDMLKIGAIAQTAPAVTLLAQMQDAGIYPV